MTEIACVVDCRNKVGEAHDHQSTYDRAVAHRGVFECVHLRNAEGARAATVELLGVAARDLDSKVNSRQWGLRHKSGHQRIRETT